MLGKAKKIIANPFFIAFLFGIAFLHLTKAFAKFRAQSIPDPLVYVADWQLTDHLGRKVGKKDFLGKLIIADFFFTSCPTICPILTQSMKDLYSRLSDRSEEIVFLSITVDPKNDTKEVLNEFLIKNGLVHKNWFGLTGSPDEIKEVISQSMKVYVGDKDQHAEHTIPHLAHLALFDKKGDLRGLFRTTPLELSSMLEVVKILLNTA